MGYGNNEFVEYELPYSFVGKIVDKLAIGKDIDKEVTLEPNTSKKRLS